MSNIYSTNTSGSYYSYGGTVDNSRIAAPNFYGTVLHEWSPSCPTTSTYSSLGAQAKAWIDEQNSLRKVDVSSSSSRDEESNQLSDSTFPVSPASEISAQGSHARSSCPSTSSGRSDRLPYVTHIPDLHDPRSTSSDSHHWSAGLYAFSDTESIALRTPSPVYHEPKIKVESSEDEFNKNFVLVEVDQPELYFSCQNESTLSSQVPLRTSVKADMRQCMGVFRLNPFTNQTSDGRKSDSGPWSHGGVGPLEEQPKHFIFKLQVDGNGQGYLEEIAETEEACYPMYTSGTLNFSTLSEKKGLESSISDDLVRVAESTRADEDQADHSGPRDNLVIERTSVPGSFNGANQQTMETSRISHSTESYSTQLVPSEGLGFTDPLNLDTRQSYDSGYPCLPQANPFSESSCGFPYFP